MPTKLSEGKSNRSQLIVSLIRKRVVATQRKAPRKASRKTDDETIVVPSYHGPNVWIGPAVNGGKNVRLEAREENEILASRTPSRLFMLR